MPVTTNIDEVAKAFEALAAEIDKGVVTSFDYIGTFAVKQMQAKAPVDTGFLKRNIKKVASGPRSTEVLSSAPYSAAVDRGHKTRQGTGTGEHYKPKPGGKTFIPANPFFTSVVNQLKGDNGELIRRAKQDMDRAISVTLSKYNVK